MAIAATALRAQQARMRIIAENVANANSTASTPGGKPYARQVPVFAPLKMDEGMTGVQMARVAVDTKPFKSAYDPSHPAANTAGYVLLSNVETTIEALDYKAAQRAYEANLNVIDTSHAMEQSALDMLNKR